MKAFDRTKKMRFRTFFLFLFGLGVYKISSGQTVSTIAGVIGAVGSVNADAQNSTFNNPHGVEVDREGNVYIADRYNHQIRKRTADGKVITVAGSGMPGSADGQGTQASFKEPWGLTVDSLGNVYVADTKNNKIRKISTSGKVTTLAGSGSFGVTDAANPLAASFGNPTGIAIDKQGNLYVGDHLTHLIRKISPNGAVSTLAGNKNYPNNTGFADGLGQAAKFYRPYGIEVDEKGNVYVADEWNHAIRKISPLGQVTTLAGSASKGNANGIGSHASFNYPWDVAIDKRGNVYVADGYNYVIRKIDSTRTVSTFAGTMGTSGGTNGPALQATFNGATSISLSNDNTKMIVGDAYNQLIREIEFVGSSATASVSMHFQNQQGDSMSTCEGTTIPFELNSKGNIDHFDIYIDGIQTLSTFDHAFSIPSLAPGNHTILAKGVSNTGTEASSNELKLVVKKNSSFTLKTISKTPLCEGDSVIVSTSDNSRVIWNTGDTSSSVVAKSSSEYYVTSAQKGECLSKQDTVALLFHPTPDVQIQHSAYDFLYEGDTVGFTAVGGGTYLWSNASTSAHIKVGHSGRYAVKVTNSYGCSFSSDTTALVFHTRLPQLKVSAASSFFCATDSIRLSANVGHSIKWVKDGVLLNKSDSALFATESGLYFFQYFDGHRLYYSDTVSIARFEAPEAAFDTQVLEQTTESERLQFVPKSSTAISYSWQIGTTSSEENSPIVSFATEDPVTVTLTVVDENTCHSTITKSIPVTLAVRVFVPTGFTPNHDGMNDEIRVRGLASGGQVQFLIFNEWGELVFTGTSAEAAWDGSFKGQPANAGNYSYLLRVIQNGEQATYSGVITLLR